MTDEDHIRTLKARAANKLLAESLACPTCGVDPGTPCFESRKPGAYEGRRVYPHMARLRKSGALPCTCGYAMGDDDECSAHGSESMRS